MTKEMTVKRKLERPKILVPAGTLEKLRTAIHYGADAVYIGGNAYGLRSHAGNFTYEEMAGGVAFTKEHDAKIYVTANMVTHEGSEDGAGEFFHSLRDVDIFAMIVSDPTLVEVCTTEAPGLSIHLSTQASATNSEALEFWKEEGLEHIVLAREVSVKEVAEIRKNTGTKIEALIHGAMCISYSGRCTLSNHISMQGTDRGRCFQSCRWKYGLFDTSFGQERDSLTDTDEVEEEFLMNAVDMSMIEHIPELVENGVDSFEIEGRMRLIHYVSTVSNVCRAAVDSYMEDPENYICKQEWIDKLWKVAQQELATGFYYDTPTENKQLFGERRKIPVYKFVGEILSYDETTQIVTICQRNLFSVGDEIEFCGPRFNHFDQTVEVMRNEEGESIDRALNPMVILTMPVAQSAKPGDMIRRRRQGKN